MKRQIKFSMIHFCFALVLSTILSSTIWAEEPATASKDAGTTPATSEIATPPSAPEAVQPPETKIINEADTLDNFRPDVKMTRLGAEINLKVTYNHPMDFPGENYIEYVRMETLDGEFLGLMTYNDKYSQAVAQFMVNPSLAKFDTVRLVAKSTKAGLIKSTHKLEAPAPQVPIKPVVAAPAKPAESTPAKPAVQETKPKKKRFGLF